MILSPLSPGRAAQRWPDIERVLAPAIAHDPKRQSLEVFDSILAEKLTVWEPTAPSRGYVVTEAEPQCPFWIIYAAGLSGGLKVMRELLADIEDIARLSGFAELRFEGRDWRRVAVDYQAERTPDGRWHFRKVL